MFSAWHMFLRWSILHIMVPGRRVAIHEASDKKLRLLAGRSQIKSVIKLRSIDDALPVIPPIRGDEVSSTILSRLVHNIMEGRTSDDATIDLDYEQARGRIFRRLLRQFYHLLREDTPFLFQNAIAIPEPHDDAATRNNNSDALIFGLRESGSVNQSSANRRMTLRDEIGEADEDIRVSRLSMRPLERIFTETRGSCRDVLLALNWIIVDPMNFHIDMQRQEDEIDIEAISHNAKLAFEYNTFVNEYNEIVGLEVLYAKGSNMIRILETFFHIVSSVIMHQPHCFNNESRMQLCKIFAGPLHAVRLQWRRLEYSVTWRGLFHQSPAFMLKKHVEEIVNIGDSVVTVMREFQKRGLSDVLEKYYVAMNNEKGQNVVASDMGHDWKPAEDDGGFGDFLYLYRTHFGDWHIDKGLIRGVTKIFRNRLIRLLPGEESTIELPDITSPLDDSKPDIEPLNDSKPDIGPGAAIPCCASLVDLGAGGGRYSEFLDIGFDFVVAYDGAPEVKEATGGRVHYINLGLPIPVEGDANDSRTQQALLKKDTALHEDNAASNPGGGIPIAQDGTAKHPNPTLAKFDITLCIEVAEHLPPSLEELFLKNLEGITKYYLVMSWSNDRENGYHLNPKTQEEVIETFEKRGCWKEESLISSYLKNVSTVEWIRGNVLVFKRKRSCWK